MTSYIAKSIGILAILSLMGYIQIYLMFTIKGLTDHHHSTREHVSQAKMGAIDLLRTLARTSSPQFVGIVYFLDFFFNYLIPFIVILVIYHQLRAFYYQTNSNRLLLVNCVNVSGLASFGIGAVAAILVSVSNKFFVDLYLSSDEWKNKFAVNMFIFIHEIGTHGFIGIVHSILSGIFFVGVGYILIQDFKRKMVFGLISIMLGSVYIMISLATIYRSFISSNYDESLLIVPTVFKEFILPGWTALCGFLLLSQKPGTLLCFQHANEDLPPEQRNQASILDFMKVKDD